MFSPFRLYVGAGETRTAALLSVLLCQSLVLCCRPGEYTTDAGICCPMCPAGSVVRNHCTAASGSIVCIPCVEGTYMDHPNGLLKCMRCKECDWGAGLIEKKKCTFISNTECECKPGYYCGESCDICSPHTECQPGQFVKTAGNSSTNTVCEPCPHGHFSNQSMAKTCTPWKSCGHQTKEGDSTSDSECGREHNGMIASLVVVGGIVLICMVFLCFTKEVARPDCSEKLSEPDTRHRVDDVENIPIQERAGNEET